MSSNTSNSTSLGGTANSKAKANALRAIDALLSEATNTAKTPTRRMQPLPPNRRDTLARSPYIPSSHPDSFTRQDYYDNDDNNNSNGKENDESESDDASLDAFSSSKEFAVLLQSHVQKQQLLHRQRLQRQHEKQQRLRDYTEHQQNITPKQRWKREDGRVDGREDGSDQEQNERYEREFGEIDPQAHETQIHASDLPNPFLGPPAHDSTSSFVTRQRKSPKAKSQNNTTAAASAPNPSTTPATSTTSNAAGSVAQTSGTAPTTTTGGATSGVTPKRQYKKTILRQQAALLAAQIKDENEIRDMEATRRVFARTNVIEHLRSLRSRLAYAHYKVDQGLEEQPLHIVAELFEEGLGESGDSDDNHGASASRGSGPTASAPTDMPTRQLTANDRGNTVGLEEPPVSNATQISSAEPDDEKQNLVYEELSRYQGLDDGRPLSLLWKTPTKNSRGRQIHVYSDEDSGSDDATDSDPGVYTPTPKSLSHVDLPTALTRDELLLQQQLQLEELQRKQLEQLQELQRMQREQQIALQKAHAQLRERHNSNLNNEAAVSASRSRENIRLVKANSNIDKENIESSTGGIRSGKGRQHTAVSVPLQQSQPKQPSPSPARDQQRAGKSSSKPRPASSLFPNDDSSPTSSTSRQSSTRTTRIANQPSRSSSTTATETPERRLQMSRQPLRSMDSNTSQNDIPTSLSQQQQEYRQRQQQKLQQNRQKEQELLQRQRLLEQRQQQQQKRKQLLLQLQQHQLQEQPQRRTQDALLPLSIHSSSALSRPKSSPFTATTIQSTPKKKKPLNPVQKAPSTENILASVRSTPTNVRSTMIATSPSLLAAKNALLGNKRAHAAFEDKENLTSTQSSPLSKETYTTQRNASSARDQTNSPSKVYKRQKPAAQLVDKSTLDFPKPSATSPALVPKTHTTSTIAVDVPASSSPSSAPSTHLRSTPEVTPVIQAPSPFLVPSPRADASEALRTSREFLKCFEQWMSDPSNGEIDNFPLDPLSQPVPQLSAPLSISNPESKEDQVLTQGCTKDYNQNAEDSDQGDETELDESEIDRLLYSEVGEDYGSYGDQVCVSTPGSELGQPELISDPGTVEVYDWFSDATQDLALYSSNDQHLSILSMDPTLSSSPAELTEALELGLEYDPSGEILWAQQEQQLQQRLQLCQQQLANGEIHELGSPRSETPQLDSTASTLLSSSSLSDILPNSITGNHPNQYIPMGLDGGLIVSNAEDGDEDQDGVEQHIQKDPFLIRNDNNFEYIFGV
ncbi:hypothetical protein BGX21_010726 [Mortierella sp. AD011]|nr:hypothetical protein BGX20_010500 [Mortierella sp. AD010]KAF9393530.1 hypothetical protein BGX21_010726 [Mortierella sp. AD011]